MIKGEIDKDTQVFLKLASAAGLPALVAKLTPEQKKNPLFKTIGIERFLSSLRVGQVDDAEIAKKAFEMEQFFLHSKLVLDAANEGLAIKKSQGNTDAVAKLEFLINAVSSHLRV